MRFRGSTARPVFRVLAGLLAGAAFFISGWIAWRIVTGQFAIRDLAQGLLLLFFAPPADTAMALVAVSGKAPEWFLNRFGGSGENPPR